MKRTMKLVLPIIASLILSSSLSRPAHAQFAGDGGFEQMQQFAPMLEMMKKKMGKKRFAMMMQTFGPMMSQMMEGQGGGFGNFGGFGGGNGFDMSAMSGMMNPEMIGGMTQMFGGRPNKTAGRRAKSE
jgi:hypothetical protein